MLSHNNLDSTMWWYFVNDKLCRDTFSWRPLSITNCSEAKIAAAEPSDVGQHCNFVSGSYITGALVICSRVYSSLNWEFLWNNEYNLKTSKERLLNKMVWSNTIFLHLRVVYWVFMIFMRNFSQMFRFRSIFFHMLTSCIPKHLSCWWRRDKVVFLKHYFHMFI